MATPFANWRSGRTEGSALRAEELAEALRQGRPVRLDGAVVEGELDLDGLEYPHRLILTHVVFLGHVHLNDARFRHTVDLSGCEFRQGVNFFATRVDGQLKLAKVRILRGDRPPVRHNFDQIQVAGRLNGTLLHSEVPLSFRQARLGEIGFDGLRVEGDLDLQIARVAGDFFFKAFEGGRSEVGGSAHMAGLQVDGHVELCGIRIGGGLNLANARIREDFRCSTAGGFRTEIQGLVSLAGARIGGVAYLDGRLFDPPEGAPAVPPRQRRRERRREFFRRLVARGELPEEGEARLKLDRTRLSKLALQERIPDRISADGMVFDDLELPACQGECEYTELLRRTRPFKRSTYLAVEAWLRNKGLDEAAKRVYVEMSARDLVTGHSSRPSRWVKWLFLGVGIGYGARPQRLIWLFLIAFALSCWVFSQPGALVSYSERLASQPEPLPAGSGNAWMTLGVALRCHFPMLLFLGDPNYVPSPAPIPGLGLTYAGYALLISAISWVLVPLFLAGLTGIVRQRQ
jgi:hypothetical protein